MAPVVSALAKYKLVFLSDQAVGKAAIITRSMYYKFDDTYQVRSFISIAPCVLIEAAGQRNLMIRRAACCCLLTLARCRRRSGSTSSPR